MTSNIYNEDQSLGNRLRGQMMDGTPLMNFGVNGAETSGSAITVSIHYAPCFYPLFSKLITFVSQFRSCLFVARPCQVIFSQH
jgi:hypothetical protein